jgi:hypothetical protein
MLQITALIDSDKRDDREYTLTPSLERQAWLECAVVALRAKFSDAGYAIPQKIRMSIGWPKRAGSCGAVGECWSTTASSDLHAELFIAPSLIEAREIVDVLAHELVHATVGVAAGHGPLFKRCATEIGLTGPMRTTIAGPEFAAWTEALIGRIGDYPAGFLVDTIRQTTRQRKCLCPACGYVARVTRKWLTAAGPPICPIDRIPMPETAEGTQ